MVVTNMWQYYTGGYTRPSSQRDISVFPTIPTAVIEEEILACSSDDKKDNIRVGPSSAKRQRVGLEPD
jgi:hypothetical protein